MNKRNWHIECKECKKSTDVSVGDFRKIVKVDFEFAQKPAFYCLRCNCECDVELKTEGESK